MPSFKQILLGFLDEFKRANDLRALEVLRPKTVGADTDSQPPRVDSGLDRDRTVIKRLLNARVRVSPSEQQKQFTQWPPPIATTDDVRRNTVPLKDKLLEKLKGVDGIKIGPGDRVEIITPPPSEGHRDTPED